MIFFMISSDPFQGLQGPEAQEALLGATAYHKDVRVVFMGKAIEALQTKHHLLREDGLKNYLKTYAALELFEVTAVYALGSGEGMPEHLPCEWIDEVALEDLKQQAQFLLSF